MKFLFFFGVGGGGRGGEGREEGVTRLISHESKLQLTLKILIESVKKMKILALFGITY